MLMRRKAFTLIELLLVIGVLIILIGIAVWALKGAVGSGAGNATKTTLANLTNMSEELNRKNKLAGFEGPPTGDPLNPIYPFQPPPVFGGEIAPALVTSDSKNTDRFGPAVRNTAEVMRRLSSIPDNKKNLEKLPSDQTLAVPPSGTSGGGTVVMDGWRNPILFVPATGLRYVASSQKDSTASGANYAKGARVIAPKQSSPANYPMVYWTAMTSTNSGPPGPDWFEGIRSPDGRAFWASAGPDGNFIQGDDNFYSFEH